MIVRINSNVYRLVLLLLLTLLLPACSDVDMPQMPSQQWQELDIALQSRPSPLQTGMNEFWIIATNPRGLPGDDMVVSLGKSRNGPWSQAIQDGHSGVYRRAVRISAGQYSVMLQLRRGRDQTVLEFPLLWPK